jgi:NitT/TauT family transport system permease protein
MSKRSKFDLLLPVFSTALLIGLWYLVHSLMSDEQRFLLPTPHAVIRAFGKEWPALWAAAQNTFVGAILGFIFAACVSFFFSLILSLSPRIRTGFYPHLMLLQMTPIVVLAPILILWVGAGMKSVVIITFLICFFPMVVNTTQGLVSTDANLVDLFRMCSASRRQEIFWLRVPAALPYFFTGLRISSVLAPIGAIVGDFYAGSSAGGQAGLGFLTIVYSSQFKMGALRAAAGVSCAMGFIFSGGVVLLSWLSLHKWHDSYRRSES